MCDTTSNRRPNANITSRGISRVVFSTPGWSRRDQSWGEQTRNSGGVFRVDSTTAFILISFQGCMGGRGGGAKCQNGDPQPVILAQTRKLTPGVFKGGFLHSEDVSDNRPPLPLIGRTRGGREDTSCIAHFAPPLPPQALRMRVEGEGGGGQRHHQS